MNKMISWDDLLEIRKKARQAGKTVVFTNGVFDLLHRGHVEYLQKARALGDLLVVGLNSDASVRRLKGEQRPLCPQEDRAIVLSALACVDHVVLFEQDTPAQLIGTLVPDVLVKGADYTLERIVGADTVLQHGGRVVPVELTPGKSTTALIDTILARCGGKG